MDIFLKIFDGNSKDPLKLEYHGNFAIELMLFAVIERFFGKDIRNKFESLLKRRLEEKEIENNEF
jgi:hypothetical protein